MPKIAMTESYTIDKAEIIKRVDEYMQHLRDEKLKAVGFSYKWNQAQDALTIDGKGFKGEASVSDSEVAMKLELSMLLSPMKNQIQDSISRGLKRVVS